MFSILLAIIATCCFIAMIISSLVAINLADKLERAEQKIQRLQAPQDNDAASSVPSTSPNPTQRSGSLSAPDWRVR